MSVGILKPLGDPGKGIHSALCGCGHDACTPLKEDLWCCHWFFLYWVPARVVVPSEVLDLLRSLMGTAKFSYLVSPNPAGILRMAVYVEDFTVLNGETFNLVPSKDNPNFVHDQCRFWRLTCCGKALRHDCSYWMRCLSENDGENGGPADFGWFDKPGAGPLMRYLQSLIHDKMRSIVI